ncbi:MAG TPA: metal ABC transporter substrate-binding protein [Nocardioidaceae bacterium]|nr:metal ABC transporter substrate-binding protein [Nocardioidaceae bacterium]
MKLVRLLAAVAVAAPLLAGCGAGTGDESGSPSVVASFYPLQYVAERVAGGHAEVQNLTSPGREPHDLELTVQQTAAVSDADVAFYESGLQPAVDQVIDENGPEHVVDATEVVDLEPASAEEGGGPDPHFWLDPVRLGKAAAAFEKQLAEVDPDHAADYATNLRALQDDLTDLDRDFAAGLADCAIDTVVVSHDAFGYLSKYGLDFEAVNGLSPDAEPSFAHIAALHDLIEAHHITTVFAETLGSKQMADALADDLGLETAVLDPIEGLSDATAGEDYLSLMRADLAALRKASQCR